MNLDLPLKLTKRWQRNHEEEQNFNNLKSSKNRSLSKIDNLIAAQNILSTADNLKYTQEQTTNSKLLNKSSQDQIDRLIPTTSSSINNHHLQMTNYNHNHHLNNNHHESSFSNRNILNSIEDVAHENHPPNQCTNLNSSNDLIVHNFRTNRLSGNLLEDCNCQQNCDNLGLVEDNLNLGQRLKKRRKKKRSTEKGDDFMEEASFKKLNKSDDHQLNLINESKYSLTANDKDQEKQIRSNSNHVHLIKSFNRSAPNDFSSSKLFDLNTNLTNNNSNSLSLNHSNSNYLANEDTIKSEIRDNKLISYNNDHHYLKFDSTIAAKSSQSKQQFSSTNLKAKKQQQIRSNEQTDNVEQMRSSSSFGTSLSKMTKESAANILDTLNLHISPSKQIVVASWIKNLSPLDCFDEENSIPNEELNLRKMQLNQSRKQRKHLDSCQTNSTNITTITDQFLNSDEEALILDESNSDDLIDEDEDCEEDDNNISLEKEDLNRQFLNYDAQCKRYINGYLNNCSNDLGNVYFFKFQSNF